MASLNLDICKKCLGKRFIRTTIGGGSVRVSGCPTHAAYVGDEPPAMCRYIVEQTLVGEGHIPMKIVDEDGNEIGRVR